MPLSIPNTTLSDGYTQATTFGGTDVFEWGFFTVANNPAFVQLAQGEFGQADLQPEVYCPPATYPIAGGARKISGIRARNAVAGSAAQFFGSMFYPQEPGIQAGTPFTGNVSPSGAVGGITLGVLDFQQATAPVGPIAGGAGAQTICITGNPVLYAGTPVVVVFSCPMCTVSGALIARFNLWIDGVDQGTICSAGGPGAGSVQGFTTFFRMTPSAGTHTFQTRGWVSGNNITLNFGAGGAGATQEPGQLMVLAG